MSFKQAALDAQRVQNTERLFRQEMGVVRRLVLIMLLGLVVITAGCGTLVERGESSKTYRSSGHYYVGVQYDWRLLTLESSGSYDYIPELCYLSIVCPFVTLLSMPIDFAVDTVMLYSDHQNKIVEDLKYSRYLKGKHCLAEGGPDETTLKRLGLDVGFCLDVRS
ncbi:YceK/YidQ family lipoprotein [Pseudomonas marginalis]|nr:YceK/YidQ family lipoprotein [Pseudomonas marginalis]